MAQKGYVLVREDQMAAKQQELATIAAEKARREPAAGRLHCRLAPPRKTAAVKQKPWPQQSSPPTAQPECHSQRREGGGPSGSATHRVRSHHQHEDRKSARAPEVPSLVLALADEVIE